MTIEPGSQGGFGSQVKPIGRRPSWLRTLSMYVTLFVCSLLVPLSLWGWDDFYRNFIEREPPSIEIRKPPVGLGNDPADFSLVFSDKHSGLDAVAIKIEQAGKSMVVFQRQYDKKTLRDEVKVTLNGKERGLKKGDANLTIAVFDRSFWSNAARASLSLIVDYDKPEISVLPDQHNAVSGGSELVFYKVREENPGFSGITIGAELFPGFPAKDYDSEFDGADGLYLVFFPIPRVPMQGGEGIRIFARDAVGNMSYAPLTVRVQPQTGKDVTVSLSATQIDERVDTLFDQYSVKQARLAGDPVRPISASTSDEDRIERLVAVNKEYRMLIAQALKPLFDRPKAQRFWEGLFARSSGKEIQSYGDLVTYRLGDRNVTQYRQEGLLISGMLGADVRAANSGIVIFADDLGVYGKTIIVDHGFGLSSLYGNLASFERLEGDRVGRGDVIGKIGTTGLTFQPSLTYEVRLHGEPVRPIEWWDAGWQRDHVESKVKNAKRALGIRSATVLD